MEHRCDETPRIMEITYVQYPKSGEWIAVEMCTDGENLINIKYCPYCGERLEILPKAIDTTESHKP